MEKIVKYLNIVNDEKENNHHGDIELAMENTLVNCKNNDTENELCLIENQTIPKSFYQSSPDFSHKMLLRAKNINMKNKYCFETRELDIKEKVCATNFKLIKGDNMYQSQIVNETNFQQVLIDQSPNSDKLSSIELTSNSVTPCSTPPNSISTNHQSNNVEFQPNQDVDYYQQKSTKFQKNQIHVSTEQNVYDSILKTINNEIDRSFDRIQRQINISS